MTSGKKKKHKLTFSPLDKERWKDFEILFGARGACGGCWCMSWRLARSDFEKQKGDGNKRAMKPSHAVHQVDGSRTRAPS